MEDINESLPRYKTLPPTPVLPEAVSSGTAPINNVKLWYALYGPALTCGRTPVVFLHGGKISSRWFAHQINHIASKGHPVIAIDTRGHGRSTDDPNVDLSYDLFADDAVALLDHLDVAAANWVGWSDGGNTCLSLAMRHGSRVKQIFAFGANYQPDQAIHVEPGQIPFLSELMTRIKVEYEAISPTPDRFEDFAAKGNKMQAIEPAWSQNDFSKIAPLPEQPNGKQAIWIVTGDSEELVQHQVAPQMRDMISGSRLVVLPDVSHFAPIQDAETFNANLDEWLS